MFQSSSQNQGLGFLPGDSGGEPDDYSFWDYLDAYGPEIFWNDGPWWDAGGGGGDYLIDTIATNEPYNLPSGGGNWWDFLAPLWYVPPSTGPQGAGPGEPLAPGLPPACYGATYHPFPIGHPQQDVCIPYPTTQARPPAKPATMAPGQTGRGSGAAAAPKPAACPAGYVLDPKTKKCVPIPKCQAGTVFNPNTGRCEPVTTFASAAKKVPLWFWLLLGGSVLYISQSDGRPAPTRGRRK